MRVLLDLVHILNSLMKYSPAQWNAFYLRLNKTELKLLKLIRSESTASVKLPAFKSFKSSYKKSLTTKLCKQLTHFSVKESEFSDYQFNVINCETLLYSFNIVNTLNLSHLSVDLAVNLLSKSTTYDLTDRSLVALKFLCNHYAIHSRKLFQNYKDQYSRLMRLMSAEAHALFAYNDIVAHNKDSNKKKLEANTLAINYLKALDTYIETGLVSNDFYLTYYRLKILSANLSGNYNEALCYAEEGMSFFESLPYLHLNAIVTFVHAVASCYLQLSLIVQARTIVLSLFDLSSSRSNPSWFESLRLLIRLELADKKYEAAYLAYNELVKDRAYKSLPKSEKQSELISKQYFNILILTGHITSAPLPSKLSINRFLRKEDYLDYNKKEVRIPIIVAQLLFNVYFREYDSMEIRLDTLKDYCARRLSSKSPFLRSNLFIRMLMIVPSSHFNAIATKRNGASYFKRLTATSFAIKSNNRALEVIPYEDLWDLVLEHLKKPRWLRNVTV